MKFTGKITTHRSVFDSEVGLTRRTRTPIWEKAFEAKTIQSAKDYLTDIAATHVLFTYPQFWNDITREWTGADLLWKNWSPHTRETRYRFSTKAADYELRLHGVGISGSTGKKSLRAVKPGEKGQFLEIIVEITYNVIITLQWEA